MVGRVIASLIVVSLIGAASTMGLAGTGESTAPRTMSTDAPSVNVPKPTLKDATAEIAVLEYCTEDDMGEECTVIWAVSPTGRGLRKVESGDGPYEPAWSPDHGKIAYSQVSDLYVVNADGTNRRKVADGLPSNPRWSPDGQRIVYDDQGDIYIVNVNGGRARQVPLPFPAETADWSPDGRHLALTRSTYNGPTDLYVVKVDGTRLRRLTRGALAAYPRWSPDGRRVLFVRGVGMAVVDADGQRLHQLPTPRWAVVQVASWSPQGKSIVSLYEGSQGPTIVYILDPTTGRSRVLPLPPCQRRCVFVDW